MKRIVEESIQQATCDNTLVVWLKSKSGPRGVSNWKQILQQEANNRIALSTELQRSSRANISNKPSGPTVLLQSDDHAKLSTKPRRAPVNAAVRSQLLSGVIDEIEGLERSIMLRKRAVETATRQGKYDVAANASDTLTKNSQHLLVLQAQRRKLEQAGLRAMRDGSRKKAKTQSVQASDEADGALFR